MARQSFPFRHLSLTALKVDVPRASRSAVVKKALEKAKTVEAWNATAAAKKLLAKKVRSNLNDFERFKVKALKQKVCIMAQCVYSTLSLFLSLSLFSSCHGHDCLILDCILVS